MMWFTWAGCGANGGDGCAPSHRRTGRNLGYVTNMVPDPTMSCAHSSAMSISFPVVVIV
jgi:hypothetical protein